MGYRITYLDVDKDGWLAPETLRDAITGDTILVTIMLANNETGTILPIKELYAIAHERGVIFHTDAVQAVGKIEVDVQELGIDLLSLSGHKFHAPKGIGALYIKKGVELEPLIHGGNQEGGLRAGTENVPAIPVCPARLRQSKSFTRQAGGSRQKTDTGDHLERSPRKATA
jgi:cysteine desulfurase